MIGVGDFQRLAAELDSIAQPTISAWAERHNIEIDAFNAVIATAVTSVREEMEEVMRQKVAEVDEDEESVTVDIGELVGNACASCFVLGWSAHEQFGGRPSKPRHM